MNAQMDQAPIACTLGADDLRARLERIAQLARHHLLAQRQEGATLHLLHAAAAASELRSIVDLERECCAFLAFELSERNKAVELTITAPTEAGEFAGLLFEHFSASAVAAAARRCPSSSSRDSERGGAPCRSRSRCAGARGGALIRTC